MMNPSKVTQIFELSLNRLDIPADGSKATREQGLEVMLIKDVVALIIINMIIIDSKRIIEIIRTVCDMLELMFSESESK